MLRPTSRPVRLAAVLSHLGDVDVADGHDLGDVAVSGVTHDSGAVQAGDLFVALPGHRTHGSRYSAAACAAGAAAILTDPTGLASARATGAPVAVVADPRAVLGQVSAVVYGNPADRMCVLGVTGTNGKTTVAAMVESGLRQAGRVAGVVGTTGIRIAGRTHPAERTTPEASDLQAILAVMAEAGVDTVVMEVSSIAVQERRVDGVRFATIAFTNLSQDHLDYHGSMAEYFAAKAALFTAAHCRAGIVGIDDEWGRALVGRATVPVRTWSLADPRAEWHAERVADRLVAVDPDGVRTPLAVGLPGTFNIANAIVAYAMLRDVGVAAGDATAGIATASVPGRMQRVDAGDGILGIVDYAHSPDAIDRVLRAGRETVDGRVIVVLGAGGDRDRTKRGRMGAVAAELADIVIVTDDNPRSEDPARIRSEVIAGTSDVAPAVRAQVREVGDRAQAVTVAVGLARAGDVVLLLGKGHEQGQEAKGVVTPFDDATVLRAALGRGGRP